MGRRIAVVNTRASNLHSVEKALVKVGASPQVVSDPGSLLDADAAVLPGVGAFDAAMRALADQDLVDAVRRFAASGRPCCACASACRYCWTARKKVFGKDWESSRETSRDCRTA